MVCPGCQKDVGTKGYCAECTEAFEGLQRDRQTAGGEREHEPAQGVERVLLTPTRCARCEQWANMWVDGTPLCPECDVQGAVEDLQARGVIREEGECGREGCSNTEGLLSLVWCAECRQATLGDECAPSPMRPCVECRHLDYPGSLVTAGSCSHPDSLHGITGEQRLCRHVRQRHPATGAYLPCPKFAEKAARDYLCIQCCHVRGYDHACAKLGPEESRSARHGFGCEDFEQR